MSLHTVTGRILNVTTRQLGTSLTQAAAAGDTTLYVDDCSAFEDDGSGGWVSINDQVIQFDTVDDDASTIHLLTALSAAADEGDPAYSWSTLYQQIDDEQTALVQVDGDTDLADPVHADIADSVGTLPDGLRGDAAETCTLTHVSPGVWEITAVGGRPSSTKTIKFEDQDTFTVAAAGDQSFTLSHQPLVGSVHMAWCGIWQPHTEFTVDGRQVTIPDPGGLIRAGDLLDFRYAYRDTPASPLTDNFTVDATLHQRRADGSYASSNIILESGVAYQIVVDGTVTNYPPGTVYTNGLGNTVPIKYPSPSASGTGWWAEADAEFLLAGPADATGAGPTDHSNVLDWSLDGGATWNRTDEPDGGVPAQYNSDYMYAYTLIGRGFPLRASFVDTNLSGNNGVMYITITQK